MSAGDSAVALSVRLICRRFQSVANGSCPATCRTERAICSRSHKSERIPCEIFYVIPSEVEAATQAAAGGEARLSIPVHYLKAALRDPSTPLRSAQDDV